MKIAYHAFAIGLLLCFCGTAQSIDLVINPDVSQETISRNALRSIFSMRMTRWPDGKPIHVFVMGDKTNLHSDFSKQLLGVFPHQLRRAWNRQIYSGMGQAPTKVESEEEMRNQVAETPGAIGYLSEGNINEHIRTISVE
ncbi:MAG: substrate-binding domain-containing protein [Candidatus Thiodiazotropha sp. (ex Codakia rugifera)]|nr:substrate-binding domain-containing protein [Candidatus Thiodiazotropha sp. (ex Codakia rugifera)]